MSTKHTPEPWIALEQNNGFNKIRMVTNLEGKRIADCGMSYTISQEVKDANLKRIVACVNAAKNVPDDQLKHYYALLNDGVTTNVKLRERNEKLVSVIKDFEEALRLVLDGHVDNATSPLARLNQTLKELKATEMETSLFDNSVKFMLSMEENQERELANKELSIAAPAAQEVRDNLKKKHKYYLGSSDGNGNMVDVHDTPQPDSDKFIFIATNNDQPFNLES